MLQNNYPGHGDALSDITVEIPDGEFVFLIGPSGAGKTTFLAASYPRFIADIRHHSCR